MSRHWQIELSCENTMLWGKQTSGWMIGNGRSERGAQWRSMRDLIRSAPIGMDRIGSDGIGRSRDLSGSNAAVAFLLVDGQHPFVASRSDTTL